jgi:hypothetical protein
MMTSRLAPSALPDLGPALRLAGPARPVNGVQGHRAAGAAARGHRAAPHQSPAPAGLGRPRGPGRADRSPAPKPADAPAGHPRHRAAVAPPPGQQEVGLSAPDTASASQPRSPRSSGGSPPRTAAGDICGSRASCSSSATGSAHPRSAGSSRPCALGRRPAGAPARPGGGFCPRKPPPCSRRLLPPGLRDDAPTAVLLVCHRSRLTLRPHPRRHRPSGRAVDHSADPQSPDGPRGPRRALRVPGR